MLRSLHHSGREQRGRTYGMIASRHIAAIALLCLMGLSGSLFAANSIGINFSSGRNNGAQVENVTGTAGFVPMANWNNVPGITGTDVPLIDSNGAASTATLTFTGVNNPYAVYAGTQATQDGQLLNSYLDTAGGLPTITFTLNNIPFTNYILYVYVGSDGAGRIGRLNVGASTIYFTTIGGAAPFAGYVQATATTYATSTNANYAVFPNLSGGSLTFTHNREPASNNTGICGIEIVEDPVSIWTGALSSVWATAGNWTGAVPGSVASTTNPDTILFNATSANPVPVVDPNRNLFRIKFDAAPGNLTLGTAGGNALLMTNAGSIQVAPTFTGTSQAMTVNAPLKIEGSGLSLINNAPDATALLNFGGAISGDAAGASTLTLSGSNIGANTINSVISNGLATPLALTKTGTGTWVLTKANTYTGATTVSAGILQLGNGTTGNDGSLAVGTSINTNAVLAVNNFGAVTLSSAISGTGSLAKSGPGVLTIPQTSLLSYSGSTTVNGGGLRVNGFISGAGTTTVGGAAAAGTPVLSGNGSISGTVNVNGAGGGAAGHVAPGANTTATSGAIGSLATGAVTLSAGAVLDFDLGTPGTGVPSTGGASDTIAITGNLNLPATGTITVNLTDNAGANGQGTIGNGTYKLFTVGGQIFNFSSTSFTIGTTPLPPGRAYIFSAVGNEIDLTIAAGVLNLTWTGAASNVWDAAAINWFNTGNSSASAYTDSLSIVTFQDAKLGGAGNVTNNNVSVRAAGVQPISVTFNNTAAGVPYTFSNASGAIGISGPTGITLAGTGTVSLQSPNTYSGATALNAGTLKISNNTSLGSGSGAIAPVNFNGGVLAYLTGAANTDISTRTVTINAGGATIDTNGLTVTYASAIGNGGSGGLTLNDTAATPGTLVLAAPSTYTGPTTVTRGTLQIGNGTTDGALVAGITNSGSLIFNVAGSVNYNSIISGTGGLTKLGAGTLTLGGVNTYTGQTTVNAGVIGVKNNSALGTGKVVLNGGGLRLQSDNPAFGINFVTGRNGTEMYAVTGTAGVVPVANWNNMAGLTGTGMALNDSTGVPNGASVSWTGAATTYSVYGAAQVNQDAQLMNSYLDQTADLVPMTITVDNVPFKTYRVYVYVDSDGVGRTGHITCSGTTYYFSTIGNVPFAGYVRATSTTAGTFTSANYCQFDVVSGSTLTVTHFRDGQNCGICGIEIVSISSTPNNNVDVTASSSVDVTGAAYGQLGNLNMGGQTLSVTGGSVGINANYVLALGTAKFSGNPTFSVANNGTGSGSLALGALDDSGTARTITLSGTGALTLAAPATSLIIGTQINITGGTVNANDPLALGANARVTAAAVGSLKLGTNLTLSSLNSAANAGSVNLGANVLTVGNSENLASSFGGVLSGTGQLTKAGTNTLTLGGASTYSGQTTVSSGKLIVTGSITGNPASGAVLIGGATASSTPTLSGTGTVSGAVTIDSAGGGGAAGHLAPGVNVTGNTGAIGKLSTGPLTLNSDSVLDFDFGTPGTGLPSAGGLNDQVAVTGDITFPPAGSVTINLSNNAGAGGNGAIAEGTYKLFSFTGSAINFSSSTSFTVGTTPLAGKSYIFTVIGSEIDLTISSGIAPLTWTGAASNLWNTTAINWFNTTTNAAAAFADNGASVVTFQDAKLGGAGNVTNNTISIQATGVRPALLTFNNSAVVPYTFSNAGGTIGIAGTTGLQMAGSGAVTLQSPNTYTGATALNSGVLRIADNSSLGSATGTIAALTFNGGTLGYLAAATNTDVSTRTVTVGPAGGSIDTNGQNITFKNPIGNNGSGALTLNDSNATPGSLILAAANTYTGGTKITAGTLQLGDGLTNGSVLGNITDNAALIFKVLGSSTYAGVISGTGTVSIPGPGTLALSGTSTYSGDTTLSGGTLSILNSSACGTGTIKLNGGLLQLGGPSDGAIGINFVTGRGGTENYSITGAAGVVPISNWNNVVGQTGSNVALVNASGTASGATVTFSGAATTYSTYGAAQANQDAQLMNSYLDTNATLTTITMTLNGIPFPSYSVYVYVNSDGAGRTGHVTVAGQSLYFLTVGNTPFTSYQQVTGTTAAGRTSGHYCRFDNVTGSNLPITMFYDGSNCGVCGIEIVSMRSMVNNVAVNVNSTIELGGLPASSLGNIANAGKVLTVNSGATVTNAPFAMTFGAATFTGNPTFNIANSGSGVGKVALGSIDDQGVVRTITVNAGGTTAGTLLLTSSATSALDGTAVKVEGGTLAFSASNALGGNPLVTLAATATMNGGGQLVSGTVRGTGTLAGSLTVLGQLGAQPAASIWPGLKSDVLTPLAADEAMQLAAGGSIDFSGGGKLKLIVTKNGLSITKQRLQVNGGTLTLDGLSALSLGVGTGTYTGSGPNGGTDIPIIVGSTGSSMLTSKFATILGLPPGWAVVYRFNNQDLVGDPVPGVPADTVVLRTTSGQVTPATITAFAARGDGAGVLLSWDCVSEFQNAGFNLYRRGADGSAWARVNAALIAGRVTQPDLKRYTFYDWAQAGQYEYKLESVSIYGVKEAYERLAGPLCVDALASMSADGLAAAQDTCAFAAQNERGKALAAKFAALQSIAPPDAARIENDRKNDPKILDVDESQISWSNAFLYPLASGSNGKLLLEAKVRTIRPDDALAQMRATSAQAATRNVSSGTDLVVGARWFSSGVMRGSSFNTAKIVYDKPGVLFVPQSMLPAGFDIRRASLQREGRSLTPLALARDGIVVFAQGYEDEYTNKDAIFLRSISGPTAAGQASHVTGLFNSAQPVNVDSPASVTAAYYDVYFDFDYRPYNYAPWFSSKYLSGGTTQSFTLNVPNASSGAAALTVNLWSLTQTDGVAKDHALQAFVNGQPAGQAAWSGGNKMLQLSFQVGSGVLLSGENKIELVTPELDGVLSQISFLHSMTLAYTRQLDGAAPTEAFNAGREAKLFEVKNVPSADAWVVDVRYPDRAALLGYETRAQAGGGYTLRFNAPSGGAGRFLVVPAGQENLPLSVRKRTVKPAKPAAYLAVGPAQFGSGVQPLLTLRAKEGLRGAFVDQEQLFDYYGYGRYGPAPIQAAVRSLKPQYLLLLGRTTYDYKNYSGLNVDPLCPAFLVSTAFWAQATSDSLFGDMGRGYPEIAIGRLPVNTPAELSGAVHHVVSYKGLGASGIRGHAVADKTDTAAGNFAAEADAFAQANPEIAWQQNYFGTTYATPAEVRDAMGVAANGGADVLLYVGHGNAVHLGKDDPRLLDTNDVQSWTGNVVFLQATCTAHWMAKDETGYKTIAIQALTQPQGGIAASVGSSTYLQSSSAMEFMNQLLHNAGAGSGRWGNALLKAQRWAGQQGKGFYADMQNTEQLFGDPAMPVYSKRPAAAGQQPQQPSTSPGTF